jgi:hypothetical protein
MSNKKRWWPRSDNGSLAGCGPVDGGSIPS